MAHVNVLKWARAHQCYGCSSYLNYFLPHIITETWHRRVVQALTQCKEMKAEIYTVKGHVGLGYENINTPNKDL